MINHYFQDNKYENEEENYDENKNINIKNISIEKKMKKYFMLEKKIKLIL